MDTPHQYVLKATCEADSGIVAGVTGETMSDEKRTDVLFEVRPDVIVGRAVAGTESEREKAEEEWT